MKSIYIGLFLCNGVPCLLVGGQHSTMNHFIDSFLSIYCVKNKSMAFSFFPNFRYVTFNYWSYFLSHLFISITIQQSKKEFLFEVLKIFFLIIIF